MPPKIPPVGELLKILQSSSAARTSKPIAPPVEIQRRALLGLPEASAVAKPVVEAKQTTVYKPIHKAESPLQSVAKTTPKKDHTQVVEQLKDLVGTHVTEQEREEMPFLYNAVREHVDTSKIFPKSLSRMDSFANSVDDHRDYDKLQDSILHLIENVHPSKAINMIRDLPNIGEEASHPKFLIDELRDREIPHKEIDDYLSAHHPDYDKNMRNYLNAKD